MGDEESSILGSMDNFLKGSLGYRNKLVDKMGFVKELSERRVEGSEGVRKVGPNFGCTIQHLKILVEQGLTHLQSKPQLVDEHDLLSDFVLMAVKIGSSFGTTLAVVFDFE
ncbi:hypothetical protein Dimus_024191 [Dionaea muscipula]